MHHYRNGLKTKSLMSEVICQRCQTKNEFYVEQSGPHIKAICNHCNNYIKFLPQAKEPPKFHFGKHTGKYIQDIDDLSYLKWAAENMTKIKQEIKDAIIKRISSLENLGR